MEGASTRIVIDLDPGDPISGSLTTGSEEHVRFVGLMQFVAAIDSLRASGAERPSLEPEGQVARAEALMMGRGERGRG